MTVSAEMFEAGSETEAPNREPVPATDAPQPPERPKIGAGRWLLFWSVALSAAWPLT